MKKVRAKKNLGQHFLNDTSIAIKITKLLDKNTDNVIEIGPGMGMLTQFLLKEKFNLETIEVDIESIAFLKKKYCKLKVSHADFLKIDIKKRYLYNFSLIGNFPYNISSQILFKIYENKDQITEVVGMFQKEVAERIASKKGKKRGILSVLLQTYYDIEYCFTVDENVFNPIPKVKSGVIKLKRNSRGKLSVEEKKFKQIIKASFSKKRKTLKNALKPFTFFNQKEIANLLSLRAEQLSVDEFIKITHNVR